MMIVSKPSLFENDCTVFLMMFYTVSQLLRNCGWTCNWIRPGRVRKKDTNWSETEFTKDRKHSTIKSAWDETFD